MAQDNYAIQAADARRLFLTYDQQALIEKHHLDADSGYLYPRMLGQRYRIHRKTGDIERQTQNSWVNANNFGETLTLLDLLCDSRADRYICGQEKTLTAFGHLFHRALEEAPPPEAGLIDRNPEGFKRACLKLGAVSASGADMAYTFSFFEDLCLTLRFWHADEEFPAQIRWFWDENALMYLRYETMYYAVRLLLNRIMEEMGANTYGA